MSQYNPARHDFGHLMGLGDRYTDSKGVKRLFLSGIAGAASSGLSALGGKTAKLAISTTIDVAESVAKQINTDNKERLSVSKSVSLGQTLSDVVSSKIGGALTSKVGASEIRTAERQLDRAARVSTRDPLSAGRREAVKSATVNLVKKKGVNKVAEGTIGNTIQNTSNSVRGGTYVEKKN